MTGGHRQKKRFHKKNDEGRSCGCEAVVYWVAAGECWGGCGWECFECAWGKRQDSCVHEYVCKWSCSFWEFMRVLLSPSPNSYICVYVFHTWGRVCCLHQSCCCWWKGVKVGRLSEERHRASGAPMSVHPRHLETLCHSARTAFAPLVTGWEDIHTGAHINIHIIIIMKLPLLDSCKQ